MTLLSVPAAQRRIATIIKPVSAESVPLKKALGRVLAHKIVSTDLPLFDNSSVDGFAVISADVARAGARTPSELRIVADIPAGHATNIAIQAGEAARIMTGAPMPRNADAVVMLEHTDLRQHFDRKRLPQAVKVFRKVHPGSNIRVRGGDVRRGRIVLRPGCLLRPQEVGLLAMLGVSTVRVFRRPRVAILATGNELVQPDRPPRPGGIRDSNSTMLASLMLQAGCEVIRLGVARDTRPAIEERLSAAVVKRADLIVSSAGVSVGALDLMRDAIQAHGRIHFWRVNVRPGKPLAVGAYRGIPYIGLPGNPVSAFVGFELFVRPAVARLAGSRPAARRKLRVVLSEAIQSDGRESYLRALVRQQNGGYVARLTGQQGSGNLLGLVQANALLVVPAGVKSLAVGDQAEAWLL